MYFHPCLNINVSSAATLKLNVTNDEISDIIIMIDASCSVDLIKNAVEMSICGELCQLYSCKIV